MSLKLKNSSSNVLLGVGGNPTEDDTCCCAPPEPGCVDCQFKLTNIDFSAIACGACGASLNPAWDGSFCLKSSLGTLYRAMDFPGADSLSFGGLILYDAYLQFQAPGIWKFYIRCDSDDGSTQTVAWFGIGPSSAPFDPTGTYLFDAGSSCASGPASFTVGAC